MMIKLPDLEEYIDIVINFTTEILMTKWFYIVCAGIALIGIIALVMGK